MSDMIREFPPIEWKDCYPTEESITALSMVGHTVGDIDEAARYLRQELAKCAEHCCASYEEEPAIDIGGTPCLHLHFSTGGWSGAEDLMDELLDKFWIDYLMLQWNRGGHYIFEVTA